MEDLAALRSSLTLGGAMLATTIFGRRQRMRALFARKLTKLLR